MNTILSFSGGLDSTSLLLRLLREGRTPLAVSFLYGQKHEVEVERAAEIANVLSVQHKVIDLSSAFQSMSSCLLVSGDAMPTGEYSEENMRKTVVPARNSIFLSILYGVAESMQIQDVFIGAHLGDATTYPDCRRPFVVAMEDALRLGSWWRANLCAPFLSYTKAMVIEDAVLSCEEMDMDFDSVFSRTWTCYDPSLVGKTPSCVSRILAFHQVGMVDPFPYPQGWEDALTSALKNGGDVSTTHP
jgi:7-cyano-7-deazaguanine synthase